MINTWVDATLPDKKPGGPPPNPLGAKLFCYSKDTADPMGDCFFRCAGYAAGCRKSLAAPFHLNRALKHASKCTLISTSLRQDATMSLANNSPSAQIEFIKRTCSSGSSTSSASSRSSSPLLFSSQSSRTVGLNVSTLAQKAGQAELKLLVNHDLINFVCTSGMAFRALDNPHFKRMIGRLNSKYCGPSSTAFNDTLLPQECAWIEAQALKFLRTQTGLTISWDSGTLGNGKSNVHCTITTEDGRRFLFEGRDSSAFSHTGEWYYAFLKSVSGFDDVICPSHLICSQVIEHIGPERFCGISSDSTGNTTVARRRIAEEYPWIVILPDPCHRASLLAKDIGKRRVFKKVRDSVQITKLSNSYMYTFR